MNTAPLYTIEIKHIKKGWQDQTTIALFDASKKAQIENEIREEMKSYGDIAIRCRVETHDKPISYLFVTQKGN